MILWVLALIGLLTLYAPLELTRVILNSLDIWVPYWGIPVWQFILEIALFWVMYLAGMVIVYRVLKRKGVK